MSFKPRAKRGHVRWMTRDLYYRHVEIWPAGIEPEWTNSSNEWYSPEDGPVEVCQGEIERMIGYVPARGSKQKVSITIQPIGEPEFDPDFDSEDEEEDC